MSLAALNLADPQGLLARSGDQGQGLATSMRATAGCASGDHTDVSRDHTDNVRVALTKISLAPIRIEIAPTTITVALTKIDVAPTCIAIAPTKITMPPTVRNSRSYRFDQTASS